MENIREQVTSDTITIKNKTKGSTIQAKHNLTPRETQIILAGGLLNYTVKHHSA
jgi:aconitate hydratase